MAPSIMYFVSDMQVRLALWIAVPIVLIESRLQMRRMVTSDVGCMRARSTAD